MSTNVTDGGLAAPAPIAFMHDESLEVWSITGWPKETTHECGARAVVLCSTYDEAEYECRGRQNSDNGYLSDYGPDRCGAVFTRYRKDYT